MESVTVSAYAKLNLALEVVGKRPDGYHEMNMLMQSVSLCDTVVLQKTAREITLSCDLPGMPPASENIAYRAAEKFFSFTDISGGVSVTLTKRIPSQAGMAGGSADAAAVLCGLNRLYDAGLSVEELCALGVQLGADVPFCIVGSTAHVTGMGETVEPVPPVPSCAFVVVKPAVGISTGAAFQAIDGAKGLKRVNVAAALKASERGDLSTLGGAFCNTFEQVTNLEEVFLLKQRLSEAGALGTLMSGSGSAVFGMFPDERSAGKVQRQFIAEGLESYLAVPVPFGISFE